MNTTCSRRSRPTHSLVTATSFRSSSLWLLALLLLSGCAIPLGSTRAPSKLPLGLSAAPASALLSSLESDVDAQTLDSASARAPRFDAPSSELDDAAPTSASPITVDASSKVGSAEQPAAAVAKSCPAKDTRLLLIGDSLSVGLGPNMARLARDCGVPFHHHGVIGAHVTQWQQDSWLQPQLDRARPTLVVVSLGGNDFQRLDAHRVHAAIDSFVAKVRASGARLLWISPPTMPFSDKIGVREMWQQAIDGQIQLDWFPTEELVIPRAPDRVHPTVREYRKLSRTLWRWIATADSIG